MSRPRGPRRPRGRVHPGRWLMHTGLAVALGVLAGTVGVLWLHHHRTAARDALDFPPHSDGLAAVLAGLRSDGVYVAPDGTDILDAAGQAKVVAAVRASPVPVYVAVLPPSQHVGVDDAQLGQALAAELPARRAVLYVWQGAQQGDVEILGTYAGEVPGFETEQSFVGDPAVTLPRAVEAAAHTDFFTDQAGDYWGGIGGGSVLGAFIAIGIVAVIVVVAWVISLLLGVRLPGRWTWREDREGTT